MTSTIKRLLTLLLASVMLLQCVSCSDAPVNESAAGNNTVSSGSENASETESDDGYLDDVADTVRFNGEDIRFIVSKDKYNDMDYIHIDTEEDEMADPVNEAIWKRNNLIAERINVNIVEPVITERDDSIIREVMNSVTAGSDDYDVSVGHARFSIALLLDNVLYSLDSLNYIDLDKDYWASGVNDNMALDGDHFWAIGDLSISHYATTYIMLANSEIWNNNYAGQDLYDIVKEGKWTLDALREYSDGAYRDLNGNGQCDKDDVYGFATNERHILTGMFFAAGINYSDFDSDGMPYITLNSEHTVSVHEKLHNLLYNEKSVYNEGAIDEYYFEEMYVTNKTLFTTGQFLTLENELVRNMEADFMVVPMPKFDEDQENYRTSQQDGVAIYGILNVIDPARANVVACTLELMSSLGSQYVIPVYYDDVLKNKYSRDPETAEMIDLIRNSLETDFALKWSDSLKITSIFSFLSLGIAKDSISSQLEKNERYWQSSLEELSLRLEEIADQYK